MLFFLLGKKRRARVRQIARQAWLSNRSMSIELARRQIRSEFSSIWVSIAIQLAIALIKYWLDNRVARPAAGYQSDEPGA